MNASYLEVTFRHGQPLAAYDDLPRRPSDKSDRTKRVGLGLVIDFRRDGKPIGIEILAPDRLTFAAFNRVLRNLGLPTVLLVAFEFSALSLRHGSSCTGNLVTPDADPGRLLATDHCFHLLPFDFASAFAHDLADSIARDGFGRRERKMYRTRMA